MQLTLAATGVLSTAFHQNAVPLVQEIRLDNDGATPLADVVISVFSEPPVVALKTIRVESLEAGALHYIRTPDLRLDAAMLRGLVEGAMAEVIVTATLGDTELCRARSPLQLLPPSHWGGLGAAPELIAAFVRPNDPAVDVILHLAARKLGTAGKRTAIDGYAEGTRTRAWDIAAAVWAALADQGIAYVLPPASFERRGQKVRGPSDVLGRKTATCLDTALFYAACLEQAGLDPLIVLTEGHAFTGVWLQRTDFATIVIDDVQILRKRRDLEELILVETTQLTHGAAGRFATAVESGAAQVEDGAERPLDLAIDIRRARQRQIRPLDLGESAPAPPVPDAPPSDMPLDAAPDFVEPAAPPPEPDGPVDRLERWKRKLLDLTLRNKLLNFKGTRKAVWLDCPHAALLEDRLSEGKRFRFLPRSEVLTEADPRSAALHRERFGDDGRRAFLLQGLEAGDLQTDLPEADLEARLTELFRLTRTAFEEGGANILFLAMGFLNWTQTDTGKASRAPVLLIPVSLQRSSVRSGFRLALHEEEARFNPTLIEMLRQDFELRMPEFERDLPTDASGLAVKSILQMLRAHVRDLKGWEVTEEVVLSTFSFTKFLMWQDLVERVDDLKQSPLVRHLIDTPKQTYGDASDFPDAARMDVDFHPREIFAPLSADSSQLAAVMAAARGKDFVLFGPPGTGKSQTIANIIAQCLASGRTVLFVSQKTAALEVVQRRLADIGLGDYCLEVHSAKAQKSTVLGRLKAAWHDRHAPGIEDWDSATADLCTSRDALNRVVEALHRPRETGLTAYMAFGRVIAGRETMPGLRLDWPREERPTLERMGRLRRVCIDLGTALKAVGPPAAHPLGGIETTVWSPDWRRDIETVIDATSAALPALGEAAADFAGLMGLGDLPLDRATLQALKAFGGTILDDAGAAGIHLLGPEAPRRRDAIVRLQALQARADPVRRRLSTHYAAEVFGLDLGDILGRWQQAGQASIFTRGSRQAKVREMLAPYVEGKGPDDPSADLRALIGLIELVADADALAPDLAVLGLPWAGLSTDADALVALTAWADAARAAVAQFAPVSGFAAPDLTDYVVRLWADYRDLLAEGGEARRAHATFASAWEKAMPLLSRLDALAGRSGSTPPAPSGPAWIGETLAMTARWRAALDRARPWCFWTETAAAARQAGLGVIVDGVASGAVAPTGAGPAFELAFARWWAESLVTEDPVLRAFLAERHEDEILRFRKADDVVAALTREILRTRLKGDVPLPTAFGTDPEWGALSRELIKKARHMPIRQLFAKIPTALTRLTPCMMMSPLSIAQFLPPGSKPFDVVLFDEASQIPAWDAIGAIARARQAIIVGDPEQLPPTNVGDRGTDEVEDGTDVEDQESILDECLASNIPARRLAWHYRSRHESLITFANHAYYKGQLITFPSAETTERAVHLVPVPGGVYGRGKSRTNVVEARAVVRDVVRRLKEPGFAANRLSLGVVTFNGEQQRLIENLIDDEKRAHPEIEPFFDAARWHEPVFVKNLENVQGDERDIILFSVTFAPDETGRPIGTVSSLNKHGGHRRLNVAITRARREMAIFSTLRPDQIALSGKGARGVRDFKHFLDYAERGPKALAEAAAPLDRGTESPFEDAVKQDLERRGWAVQTQIGVSAFRIDLGIVHPDAPGRYLAGVECDGATYHRSATARDRDRLRETVLRGLGWRIRRVWSTEWWMDAATAAQKLHDQLAQDLEEDRAATAARAAAPNLPDEARVSLAATPVVEPAAEPPVETAERQPASGIVERSRLYADARPTDAPDAAARQPYRRADLAQTGFGLDAARFYDADYRPTLRALVAHVVDSEAPVFEDVVIGRIAAAHGFGRAGGRIRESVLAAFGTDVVRTEEAGRIVLWTRGGDSLWVEFRPASREMRDHADVPLAELAGLARLLAASGGSEDEVVRAMASAFALGTLREPTRARFAEAMRLASTGGPDAPRHGTVIRIHDRNGLGLDGRNGERE